MTAPPLPGRSMATVSPDRRLALPLRAVSWIAVLAMIPLVFYFTTRGTWSPREHNVEGGWSATFFLAQAQSMLHGHMDVDPSVLIGECFEREGRCYGYFGITPSVIRMLLIGILR